MNQKIMRWIQIVLYLLTPEDADFPGAARARLPLLTRIPVCLGHIKLVFWFVMALVFSFAISALR